MLRMTGKKKEKIHAHYNTPDYFKHFKKKYKGDRQFKQSQYVKVLKDFFDLVVEDLIMTGQDFILPQNMGKIQIRKTKPTFSVIDGEVKNNLPINYRATNKLWEENPEAKKNKVLVRYTNKETNGYVFRYSYIKYRARYKHKGQYKFKPTRTNKQKLVKLTKQYKNKIDFLKLY